MRETVQMLWVESGKCLLLLVPPGRIELPTSPLPRVRSTTELQQRLKQAGAIVAPSGNVKHT